MNKKIGIFMVFVLLVGTISLSACSQQEAVGRDVRVGEGESVSPNGQGDQMDVNFGGGGSINEAECNNNEDCEEGYGCVDGECVIIYRANKVGWDCKAAGYKDGVATDWTDCGSAGEANDKIAEGCLVAKMDCAEM